MLRPKSLFWCGSVVDVLEPVGTIEWISDEYDCSSWSKKPSIIRATLAAIASMCVTTVDKYIVTLMH